MLLSNLVYHFEIGKSNYTRIGKYTTHMLEQRNNELIFVLGYLDEYEIIQNNAPSTKLDYLFIYLFFAFDTT